MNTTTMSKSAENKIMSGPTAQMWWVPDEAAVWTLATQSGAKQPNGCINFTLHKDKSVAAFQAENCIQVVGELSCPEDLVFLHDVNQASILNCIRERFLEKKIYTSVGAVLMTVNPFERIPGIYGPSVIKKYSNPDEKKPFAHVYEIPSRAYENMCRAGGNQSILISGESGAGKTEATKQCLNYLTVVANTSSEDSQKSGNAKAGALTVTEIANRIIAASPILEAFGNAKTIRNPNSSRFGKWMVLNFDNKNTIHSSNIVSYLLEKSRVTKRDSKERNYHIFYQVLRGCDRGLLSQWKVSTEARNFLYLQQDDGKEPVNLDDAAQYIETETSFGEMGFSVTETQAILKVVCSILLLGNVCFNSINDGEGSEVANPAVVDAVAELLGVTPAILCYALTNRSIESRKSMIAIVLNPQKAAESRDSLARQLYDKVFLSIITQINLKSRINEAGDDFDRCIGLLDIFGFEIFVENSFEQVCINYCNEMLQHHFNFVVFTAEKNLYLQEGIVCETIEFRDNSEVIREIEGLFKSLDEEARIPKGTSKTWFDKLKRGAKLANVSFPNRRVGQVFVVKHYAGDVDYNPLGMLEKNTESLSNDLVGAMLSSTDSLIQAMFDPNPVAPAEAATVAGRRRLSLTNPGAEFPDSGKPSPPPAAGAGAAAPAKKATSSALAAKSISWNFTNQLTALMSMLKKTESHFIRCVKSNEKCVAATFDSKLVHKQLLYSGVFEVVKIQQSGLPCRLKHEEFLSRYKCLAPSRMRYTLKTSKELLTYLTSMRYDLPMAQMGRTQTFFKSNEQRVLETARNELFRKSATKIQRCIRRVICSYYFRHLRTHYRAFMHSYDNLILAPAQEAFDGFNQFLAIFARIRRYPILRHVSERLVKQLSILGQRVELVAEARRRLLNRTEEGVLSLQDILTSAIDLDLTSHAIVVECKTTVKMYFRALEFMDLISVPVRLRALGMTHINEGIESLVRFQDLLVGATVAIEQAQTHKRLVDMEIKNIVQPLRAALINAVMQYDSVTGNLKPKLRGAEDYLATLRALVRKFSEQSMNFNCTDSQFMYNDCSNFLTFLEEFVPMCDAVGALHFIDSRECKQSTNAIFISQLEEFRKWADMQMTTVKLKEAMAVGKVSLSSLGNEPPVLVDAIQELLDQMNALRDPSQNLKNSIRAGTWILKLRKAYCAADWLALEQLVIEADNDGVENFVFDDFPDCVDELNNCQWQVIYHGLTSDALSVLSEPCFANITMQMEQWVELVRELPDNMTLVETIQDFAVEDLCPQLYRLVPLLENTLQLRSLMYQRDLELSKVLYNSFLETHREVIEYNKLLEPVTAELKRCGELIRKIELEEELDHLLATITTAVYAYEGVNEMPTYHSLYNQTHSVEDLSAVLKDFEALGETFQPALQEKIDLATTLLKGRRRMMQAEDTEGIIWNDCLTDFEEGMTACLRGSHMLPDYIKAEYEIVVGELIRRSLLQGYMQILRTICVRGEVDVNVSVDPKVLAPQYHQYNNLSQLMSINYDEFPNNIKALTRFTSCVLKLRKHVVDDEWGSSLQTLLEQLTTMDHGGGINVPGVKGEIEKVRAELIARQAIARMKDALENIPVTVPENSEDTMGMVDLQPLRDAVVGIAGNNGKQSKQLKALAESVIVILESLVRGEFNKVNPAMVDDAAAQYVAYHLNSTAIERIFRYTRIHNFLKNLCDAMREYTSPEQLFTSINAVRSSLISVPQRFIPWLKAAYIYCESVSANATGDWIKMVEATRKLEECIQLLSGVKIIAESEALNENIFLELMHEKAATGYAAALRIKASEQKQRTVEEIQHMSSEELAKLKIKQEDEENPYGITQLRLAGYDDSSILNVKFPVKYLWALDFDPVLLRKKGFKASKLLAAGYSITSLYQAGFNVAKLKAAGCSVDALRDAGVSFDQLRLAGFEDHEILMGQLPNDFLKSVEYDASKLLRMGMALKDLVAAGLTALELRAAGFTAMELKQAGITSVSELRNAGFDLQKLKAAFDIYELHDAGFTFGELQASGVDDKSLLDAGFGVELEQQALRELYITTNGPLWKVRLNWCTSKPLSQWFGIRTERDVNHNERVVAIDLTDNHLIGVIPEKLWVLTRLRSLHLGLNFLTGSVPPLLANLLRTNNVHTDLHNPATTSSVLSEGAYLPLSPPAALGGMGGVLDTDLSQSQGGRRLDFDHADSLNLSTAPTPMRPDASLVGNTSNSSYMGGPVAMTGFGRSTGASTGNNGYGSGAVNHENDFDSIDRSALMEFFHATNGAKWLNKTNWGSTRPIGEWKGVTVSKSGNVIKLVLPSNNLQGSIPNSIYYLENLRELDLRLNQLCGPIPETLGHMRQLTHVYLQNNRLSGSIPASLGDLTLLELLDLRSNQLSDHVPKTLSALRRLRYLGLKSNLLKSRPIELQQMLPWCKLVT